MVLKFSVRVDRATEPVQAMREVLRVYRRKRQARTSSSGVAVRTAWLCLWYWPVNWGLP